MTEEEVGAVAMAVCRSLMGGRDVEPAFLFGEATGGHAYLEAAREAIESLDKHRADEEFGPDETPEDRADRIAMVTSGGIERTTAPMWRTKG